MFAMFRNLFAAAAALFSATEKLANAANHGAAFVEGEAAGFNERTALARAQELKRMRAAYDIEDHKAVLENRALVKQLDAPVLPEKEAQAA